jgi:hypothetical protein
MKGRRRVFGTTETRVKRFHDQKDHTDDQRTGEFKAI